MFFAAAFLMALLTPQDTVDTGRGILTRTFAPPSGGVGRCQRNLTPGRRDIPIECTVNSVGRPTACTFPSGTPTREERYAAECTARAYRYDWEDGRPAEGIRFQFTVRMHTP